MNDIEKRARELLAEASGWNVDDMVEHLGSDVCLFTAEEALEAVRAALKPQWQPIATAPKDGSTILIFGAYVTGERDEPVTWSGRYHPEMECFIAVWDGEHLNDATHWMPMPAGPEVSP